MDLFNFKSEELLRQVVVKLLMRMPDVYDVQLIHGPQEFGKDIVFWSTGPLGEHILCACVIKNGKIGGSVDRPSDARTVCHQVEQALDTPFTDAYGQEQFVQNVYIITPEPISQSTMNSIKGWLRRNAGTVAFIPGEKLFELIRTYWTDFFAEEFAAFDHHLQQLTEQSLTDELREVSNIYGLPSPENVGEIIYVPRIFTRSLNIYENHDLVSEPIPGDRLIRGSWTDRSLMNVVNFLEGLGNNLEHLRTWALLGNADSPHWKGKSISELRATIIGIAQSLKSELILEQAKGAFEGGKTQASKIDKHEREYTLTLPAVTIANADRIRNYIFQIIAPLREAVRVSRALKQPHDNIEMLLSNEAKLTAELTDCLATAPAAMLEPTHILKFEVGEEEIHKSSYSWFIVGPAGYGKTSFCRWHSLVDAQLYRSEESNIFPIYVPLNILARRELKSYEEAFLRANSRSALLPEDLNKVYPDRKIKLRLYLDGLDEVPDLTKRRQIAELAKAADSDGIQVFLTSRDYVYMPELLWLTRIRIGALDSESQNELVARILQSPRLTSGFYEQLKLVDSLNDLMGVPLLARLIVLVFRQTGELPENRPRLYATFVDLLSGGWDLAKGLLRQSHFGKVPKKVALCRLAGTAHEARSRYFSPTIIEQAIRATASAMSDQDVASLRAELLRDGLLSRSARTFYFSHLSFQEFLCASYYYGSPDRSGIEAALNAFLSGDDWWREVINFYIGLSENPAELSHWLAVKLKSHAEGGRGSEIWQAFRRSFSQFDLGPDT